jgi:MFS family permease
MEIFKERFRGVAYGVMSMAMGLGFATLCYTGGYFITTHGYHPLFIICASVSVVAAILLISIQRFIATTSVNE